MKLFITGAAGFIGSHFAIRAVAKGHKVTVADCLTYASNLSYISTIRKKIQFHNIDIRKASWQWMDRPTHLWEYVKGNDCIINFAAESHVDNSIADPHIFAETNIMGTLNLLECARKLDIDFIQISTDEVYGDVGGIEDHESYERDILLPSSPYSASKASADMLVMAYARTYGLKTKITRSCNNYGPHQHIEKVVPKFIVAALKGEPLTVYGKGKAVREWIYVADNVDAIMAVLEKGDNDEIYNIGTGERYSVLEIANMIVEETKSKSKIKFVGKRPGEDMRYSLNSSKIREFWCPEWLFKHGLKETIKWYEARL